MCDVRICSYYLFVPTFVTMPAQNLLLLIIRMKNSSGANQSSGPVPKTPTTPTVSSFMSFRKFALAEFRYGKEDILALYAENFTVSGSVLQSVSLITSEIVKPMAFLPYSEEEQVSTSKLYEILFILNHAVAVCWLR